MVLVENLPAAQSFRLHKGKEHRDFLILAQCLSHGLHSVLEGEIGRCLFALVIRVEVKATVVVEDVETFLAFPHGTEMQAGVAFDSGRIDVINVG